MSSLNLAPSAGPLPGAPFRIQEVRPRAISQPDLPPGLFSLSDSWGRNGVSKTRSALGSILVHGLFVAAIAACWFLPHNVPLQAKPVADVVLIAPSLESYALPLAPKQAGGGGGGGDREKIEAPKGKLPPTVVKQIVPPAIVVRNEHPKLTAEPTVVAPQIQMASAMPNLGNPAAPPLPSFVASNGTGSAGGLGSGAGGGIGKGSGPGVGEGHGGGIGGGVYRVGGAVLAPHPLSMPDPEYTEQARDAKLQGMCVVGLIVGADGKPRDLRVIRKLGMGLDEKAMLAVSHWTFEPATRDGIAVPVQISVQVSFKLD